MIPFGVLRSNAYFAPMFGEVHPLFWPVLWWSLNQFLKWCRTADYDVMFSTTWWGSIRIFYFGDKKVDPSAYRPYVRTRPRFDDPVWQSAVPLAFAFDLSTAQLNAASFLPRFIGGLRGSEIALRFPEQGILDASLIPNTS